VVVYGIDMKREIHHSTVEFPSSAFVWCVVDNRDIFLGGARLNQPASLSLYDHSGWYGVHVPALVFWGFKAFRYQ